MKFQQWKELFPLFQTTEDIYPPSLNLLDLQNVKYYRKLFSFFY